MLRLRFAVEMQVFETVMYVFRGALQPSSHVLHRQHGVKYSEASACVMLHCVLTKGSSHSCMLHLPRQSSQLDARQFTALKLEQPLASAACQPVIVLSELSELSCSSLPRASSSTPTLRAYNCEALARNRFSSHVHVELRQPLGPLQSLSLCS